MNTIVQLFPLECSDREQFILDNQEAFNYGAMEEFGLRDDHFEDCLLYTSPSPRDGLLSRMPSSA